MTEHESDREATVEEDRARDGVEGTQESSDDGWSSPFDGLQEMMEDLVDGFRGLAPPMRGRYPRMEMAETEEHYVVWMDLPGVAKKDLSVSALGDELTVSGQRRRPDYPEGAQVRRSERSYGRFRRSVRLPADVDPGDIGARLDAGVLMVTLPRRVETEGRTINVETD